MDDLLTIAKRALVTMEGDGERERERNRTKRWQRVRERERLKAVGKIHPSGSYLFRFVAAQHCALKILKIIYTNPYI